MESLGVLILKVDRVIVFVLDFYKCSYICFTSIQKSHINRMAEHVDSVKTKCIYICLISYFCNHTICCPTLLNVVIQLIGCPTLCNHTICSPTLPM